MIVNNTAIQTTMKVDTDIMVNRYIDRSLTPLSMNISFDICSLSDDPALVQNRIQKVLFFINTILHESIMLVPEATEEFAMAANLSDNNVIFTPTEPSDEVIALLLYSKMSQILGKDSKTYMSGMNIKTSDNMLAINFDASAFLNHSKGKFSSFMKLDELPYCEDFRMMHHSPWWERDDGFTYEFILDVDDERDIVQFYSDMEIVDPLSFIEDHELQDFKDDTEPKENNTMIIKINED